MSEIKRSHTGARMSQIVEHGDLVYLAGQVDDDASDGITAQTEAVLAKIENYLEAAGSDKTRILSAIIWLTDIGDYDAFNAVWDAWVPEGTAPARTCVETPLAKPQFVVEVTVTAAKK